MAQKAILLVEDDFLNRRLSKKVLVLNGYTVLEAKNTKEAMEILQREIIDLAILDIHLGEGEQSGLLLGQLLQEKYEVPFIYLTAYDNAAVIGEAVSTLPYSYLTKPFKDSDLIASVEIAIRQSAGKHIPKMMVKDGEYTITLPVTEINFIESDGNYLKFHTDHKTYKLRSTIKQVLETLPERIFLQVHRAYVVNKTKIARYSVSSVVLGDVEIPVSRNYSDNITKQVV